jgi:hypothetical protein
MLNFSAKNLSRKRFHGMNKKRTETPSMTKVYGKAIFLSLTSKTKSPKAFQKRVHSMSLTALRGSLDSIVF